MLANNGFARALGQHTHPVLACPPQHQDPGRALSDLGEVAFTDGLAVDLIRIQVSCASGFTLSVHLGPSDAT